MLHDRQREVPFAYPLNHGFILCSVFSYLHIEMLHILWILESQTQVKL